MSSEPLLVARGLTRSFGERHVLGPLDIEAMAGERIALVGPNGSGKSSLLRCIAGTLLPSGGTVTVAGASPSHVRTRALIGTSLSQERSFYLRLTGLANLLVFARLRASAAAAKLHVDAVVDELELAEIAARRVDSCSTGMVQQLALARALLGDPPLVLLDEPTRSLDAGAIERMWGAITRRAQTTVLVATHRPEDIERCDRRIELGD